MVVDQIHVYGLRSLESEHHAPVTRDPNAPLSASGALQRVKVVTGHAPAGSILDYATRNVARYCSGVRFAHKGLRRFYERGDARGLNAVARVRRLLTALQDASSPQDMALPGCRLHRLTGDRRGQWSVRVSGNWRIVFRFVDGEAVDVDLIDYH